MRHQHSLGWESLQLRRYTNRLSMLFRIQHGLVDVTTFNPTTPVREVPNACGSYKQLKTSTSSHFTLILSVTGNDCIPLLPMSRLSRNLGKAYQVCLPSSCNPTRLSHLNKALTRNPGHFTCFIGHHRVTYSLRRLLPLKEKKKKEEEVKSCGDRCSSEVRDCGICWSYSLSFRRQSTVIELLFSIFSLCSVIFSTGQYGRQYRGGS